jgi:hypothetical protein
MWAAIAQSILRFATGGTVRRSNPGGGEIFRTSPDRSWAHPASYTMGAGSFPRAKRPGRDVDYPPHPAPRLKKEYSYTSTPPLGLHGLLYSELYLYIGYYYYYYYYYYYLWLCSPARAMASSFTKFFGHAQRRTTVGRIPMDE